MVTLIAIFCLSTLLHPVNAMKSLFPPTLQKVKALDFKVSFVS